MQPRACIRLAFVLIPLVATVGCRSERLPNVVDYNYHVKPILSDRCYSCHGPDAAARQANLRLDTRAGLLDSLLADDSIPVVPGSRQSTLYRRVTSKDIHFRMPPPESNLTLSERDIAMLGKWIDQGANVKNHWSFVPPSKPQIAELTDESWPRGPIDKFVLAKMEEMGHKPSAAADRATLLRRVSLDLTGLPPTPEELDAFLSDETEDAYEKAVDRLLASSRYGERWAWNWLDAARYADTNGYQGDPVRTMWPWRDWVIQAINSNMPYDDFTVLQLAGDLLRDASAEHILPTAFNRNHMYNGEGGRIPEETRIENVFDRLETVGTVWMGLTLTCARCHDHKYDPISHNEYFSLFDFFNQTSETGSGYNGSVPPVLDVSSSTNKTKLAALVRGVQAASARVAELEARIFPHAPGETAGDSPLARGLLGEHVDALHLSPDKRSSYYLGLLLKDVAPHHAGYSPLLRELLDANAARDQQRQQNTLIMVMDQLKEPRETFVLVRGSYNQPADTVAPGTPRFLPPMERQGRPDRLALARWLVSPAHPLTARVTVNRFWQAFFGTGIVATPGDFGAQGELPSHPELLDFLAVDFVESGWNVKALHRQIVTSATYRQSSQRTSDADPDNKWLARGPRMRLPSWMIRDQALQLSGLLTDSVGGPPVFPYQPEGVWNEATFGQVTYSQDSGGDLYRRSLYTFWRRIVGPTSFFDNADRQVCTVRSVRTNTPLHALVTLNDVTYVEAARVMAERIMEVASEDTTRIRFAFRQATARLPDQEEEATLRRRLDLLRAEYRDKPEAATALLAVGEAARSDRLDTVEHAAFTGIAMLLLNLDETITKQ